MFTFQKGNDTQISNQEATKLGSLVEQIEENTASISYFAYCAFDIFQKVIFCLALYTEEVNLQIFVMI